MSMRYDRAWVTKDRDGEHAVVVVAGKVDDPYYWVICPATTTLHINGRSEYLDDCSDGASCAWTEQHKDAAVLINALEDLIPLPASAGSAPSGGEGE